MGAGDEPLIVADGHEAPDRADGGGEARAGPDVPRSRRQGLLRDRSSTGAADSQDAVAQAGDLSAGRVDGLVRPVTHRIAIGRGAVARAGARHAVSGANVGVGSLTGAQPMIGAVFGARTEAPGSRVEGGGAGRHLASGEHDRRRATAGVDHQHPQLFAAAGVGSIDAIQVPVVVDECFGGADLACVFGHGADAGALGQPVDRPSPEVGMGAHAEHGGCLGPPRRGGGDTRRRGIRRSGSAAPTSGWRAPIAPARARRFGTPRDAEMQCRRTTRWDAPACRPETRPARSLRWSRATGAPSTWRPIRTARGCSAGWPSRRRALLVRRGAAA